MCIRIAFLTLFFLFPFPIFAQNTYEVYQVTKEQNPSFFEKGKEISSILISAVRAEKIKTYSPFPADGGIPSEQTLAQFEQNMKIPAIKGALITDDKEAISFPENAKWFAKDVSVFSIYESKIKEKNKIEYLSLFVPYNDKNIFIATFRFKDVAKIMKKSKLAVWDFPAKTSFGEVLHTDLDDGSAYQLAKTLIKSQNLNNEFVKNIDDDSRSYQWLVRPIEKQNTEKNYYISEIELYYENDSTSNKVGSIEFGKVKEKITAKENYLLNYAEAIRQKLFVNQTQATLPTPVRKEKISKLFQKEVISDLNMKDKDNQSLFQEGNELVRYLFEAVKNKKINAYPNDSLKTKLTLSEFETALLSVPPVSIDDSTNNNAKSWEIRQLYKLNLIEAMLFDQFGKQKTYQPRAVSIILPAQENTIKGIDEPLIYFSYKGIIKLLKKKKLASMRALFENRNFKAIPLFMKGIEYK